MKIIAHRAGCVWAPENTLGGVKRSVDFGVDIEIDVRRCKTGELFLMHWSNVGRTTDGRGRIRHLTYSQVKRLTVRGPHLKDERPPLLAEVLEAVDGKISMHMEVKSYLERYPDIEEDIVRLLEQYRHADKVTVTSFDHALLRRLKTAAPQLRTGALLRQLPFKEMVFDLPFINRTLPLPTNIILDRVAYVKSLGASHWYARTNSMISAAAVQRAHQAGLKVFVWTVNQERQWKHFADIKVDGIITDNPVDCAGVLSR